MRKSLLALTFSLAAAATLPAQFIHDLRPHRPPQPITREPRLLPIQVESHRVEVKAQDGVARSKVHLVFRNPNGLQLEGTFMFPLPGDAAIGSFAMLMGGKMVQGEVLEKDKAAGIYQSIVQRQRDPALLEYVGRRLFQARVFPIPASGTTEIELTYDEPLRRDGQTIEYRYPFRTKGVSGAPVGRAAFTMEVKSQDPVLTIYSPSHEVDVVKKGDHEARVSYERGQEPGDKDLVVVYGLSKEAVGATLFSHAESGDEGAFLLLLAPSAGADGSVVQKDVVFVVDTSGSMAGDKIEQTRKALEFCISSLRPGDRFNLVPFATEAQPIFEGLVAVDETHRQRTLGWVREKMVARGGTNINDALVSALGMSRDKDRPFVVIFMTDGEPTIGTTTTEGILANVKNANKALTRLFVFGVGEELKVDLLDLLAEQNHGARDYVGTRENIEVRISSFFDKVSSPVLSDVEVEVEKIRVSELCPAPRQIPDLFRGSQLLLTGRYQGHGGAVIRLKGKVNGKPTEHVFELEFKPGGENTSFVPRLWAVRKVGYLMDQIRLHGENKELKDEVVRLGKTYGIVTPYTSYLVVEDVVADARQQQPPRRGDTGWERRRLGEPPTGDRSGLTGPTGGLTPPARPGTGGGGVRAGEGRAEGKPQDAGAVSSGVGGGAGAPSAPAPGEKADRLLERLGRTNLEAEARARPADETAAKKSGADKDRRAPPSGEDLPWEPERKLKEQSEREKEEAAEAYRRGYFTDAIALSKAVKNLRESRAGDDEVSGAFVRRVGNRTFYHRYGIYVEAPILDLEPEVIQKKLVRIEAFSKEYFDFLQTKPTLSKVFALGQSLLFLDGERIIQVVPPGALTPEPPK